MAKILVYRSDTVFSFGFKGIDWFKVPKSEDTYLSLALDCDIKRNPHIPKFCEIPQKYEDAIALKLIRHQFLFYLQIDYSVGGYLATDLIGQGYSVASPYSLRRNTA